MSEPHTDSKEEEEQLFVQGRLEFDASDAKFSFYNVRINFCVDCNWWIAITKEGFQNSCVGVPLMAYLLCSKHKDTITHWNQNLGRKKCAVDFWKQT